MAFYKFQKQDINYWWNDLNGRGILGWDMGIGKTYVGSHITKQMIEKEKSVLIICPPALIPDWIENCEEIGIKAQHIKKGETNCTVTTYDQLDKIKNKYFLVIADECHKIKNSTSKRSKIFLKLARNTDKLLMMSGTITNHSDQQELLNYLWSIDAPEIRAALPQNITQFHYRMCYPHPKIKYKFITNPYGAKVISDLITKYAKFRTRSEVLDLPPYTEKKIKVSSEFDFIGKIKALAKEMGIKISEDYEKPHLNHALMMANGMDFETHKVCNFGKIDLVEECINNINIAEPIIVWIYWKEFGIELQKRLLPYGSELVNGETTAKEKESIINRFKTGKTRILIAAQGCLAEGFNFQHCAYAIVANIYFDIIKFEQLKARIYRNGQTRPVLTQMLVCKGTIEEHALNCLNQKMNLRKAENYLNTINSNRFEKLFYGAGNEKI